MSGNEWTDPDVPAEEPGTGPVDTGSGDTGPGDTAEPLSRSGSWEVTGAAELELSVDVGRITVHVDDPQATQVRVEVRHDPALGGMWTQSVSSLISWLGQATGGQSTSTTDLAEQAVAAAEISWSEPARRLVVRSSPEVPLRVVPLDVTVWAPAGSRLAARTGAGNVAMTGTAGWAAVRTGSGGVEVDTVDGDADVTTGSGDLRVEAISGRARLRTGSGAIRLTTAGGDTDVKAGSGDVEIGSVNGNLGARTGSGDLWIADARSGQVDLTTGSGELRVGVHPGVRAELDLSSGSGHARSELDVASAPPEATVTLQVRGRTGSGDVLVTRALVPA